MIYRHEWMSIGVSVYNHTENGFCHLNILKDGGTGLKSAVLQDLLVCPEKRGKGYGRELLTWAIYCATVEGCDVVHLYADGEPWIMEWFKRHGFSVWKRIDHAESERGVWSMEYWINKNKKAR